MLKQLQLYNHWKFFILLSVLFLSLGCTAEKEKEVLSCGDLFSTYAEKPVKLDFMKCTKGTGQTLFDAKYTVSSENSHEVEKILVKQYGLMKFSDYYYSMPINEVFIRSKSLEEYDNNYTLLIIISNENFDFIHNKKMDTGFTVNVKIMDI